jgi:hypothetical protein
MDFLKLLYPFPHDGYAAVRRAVYREERGRGGGEPVE